MKRRYPDKRESVASATLRLKMLLAGCTDAAMSALTVEGLCATHNVDRRTAEYELLMARNRRSGAVR